MRQTLRLEPVLSFAEASASLAGRFLDASSYDTLIAGQDADVFDESGDPLLFYRHSVVPSAVCAAAYANLRSAANTTDNRGLAGGVSGVAYGAHASATRQRRVRLDGTVSNTSSARAAVQSGLVGAFDRNPRFPYCRTTAYTLRHPGRFRAAIPFIRAVDAVFRDNLPDRYAAQAAVVAETAPDWVIPGTVFTTLTVNRNWQTAVHTDKGDYAPGFGVLATLTSGAFSGCYLVLPRYRVAVDLQTAGVVLMNVHELHGNTPIVPSGPFERISCVFYYRAGMINCGSAAEELERAKRI